MEIYLLRRKWYPSSRGRHHTSESSLSLQQQHRYGGEWRPFFFSELPNQIWRFVYCTPSDTVRETPKLNLYIPRERERERGSWVRKRTGGSNRDRLGLVFSLFTRPEWLLFIKFLACTGVFREIYMRSILSISRELDWLRNPFLFWYFFLEIDKISLRIINLTFFFFPKESL